jgi:hypothetical protein
MAYSRWNSSVWYTYWSNAEREPTLVVMTVGGDGYGKSLRYSELRKDVAAAAESAREPGTSDKEVRELKRYMRAFMRDVEFTHQESPEERESGS